jgi:hypothetical protein
MLNYQGDLPDVSPHLSVLSVPSTSVRFRLLSARAGDSPAWRCIQQLHPQATTYASAMEQILDMKDFHARPKSFARLHEISPSLLRPSDKLQGGLPIVLVISPMSGAVPSVGTSTGVRSCLYLAYDSLTLVIRPCRYTLILSSSLDLIFTSHHPSSVCVFHAVFFGGMSLQSL